MLSYTQIKTWFDTYIKTNGTGAITGTVANTGFVSYILNGLTSLVFDSTRPYLTGQICIYVNTNVYGVYVANADISAGVWDRSKWNAIVECESITYSILATGSQDISHNLSIAPKIIQAQTSAGADISLDVTGRSTTTLTIYSVEANSNAVFNLISWGV